VPTPEETLSGAKKKKLNGSSASTNNSPTPLPHSHPVSPPSKDTIHKIDSCPKKLLPLKKMFSGLDTSEIILPNPLEAQSKLTDQNENPHPQMTKHVQPPEWIAKKPKIPYSLVHLPHVFAAWELLTANLVNHQIEPIEKAPIGPVKAILVTEWARSSSAKIP
jgi:hypothetical protein